LLFDLSHTYVTAWWISLLCGLIAALVAMDMARKAAQETLSSPVLASGAATVTGFGDHAAETAVQSKVVQS
jgi:hypothetical protein